MRSKCKARRVAKEQDDNDVISHMTSSDQSDVEILPILPATQAAEDQHDIPESSSLPVSRSPAFPAGRSSAQLGTGSYSSHMLVPVIMPSEDGDSGSSDTEGDRALQIADEVSRIPVISDLHRDKVKVISQGHIGQGEGDSSDLYNQFVLKHSEKGASVGTICKLDAGKLIGPVPSGDNQNDRPEDRSILKYIQKSDNTETSNLMAVHIQNQLYYRAIREIQAGEEMLLYAKDRFYNEADFSVFQKKMEEGEVSACRDCGEVFKDNVTLHKHQLFSCNNSRSDYGQQIHGNDDIKSHMQDMLPSPSTSERDSPDHLREDGEFKCEECPRSFALKSNLARHQIVHESGRRFSCEHCERHFTDPSNLQRHIRSQHHGARCHACTDCGKTFATSSGLKQHQHIHSSVKPFQCEVCLKAYTQFSNLCRHKRMHADCRQQIKCNDCGQAFSTITSLSKHKRFCEGALRNGMRLSSYGSPDSKLSPSGGLLGSAQSSPFSPAMMMGLYGASRPAYPFYPTSLGNLPMFPAGHPLSALTSLSPGSLRTPGMPNMAAEKSDLSPAEKYEKREPDGSDAASESSDLDIIPSDSESEKSLQQSLNTSTSTVSVTVSKPTVLIPSPLPLGHNNQVSSPKLPRSPMNKSPVVRSPSPPSFTSTKADDNEDSHPFDLSMPTIADHVTPPKASTVGKSTGKAEGEQPLDLSQTKPARNITPPEAPRKTHIFGEVRTPVSVEQPKLHYAYPQFSKQLIMEQAMRMAESTKEKSPTPDTSFLRYPRFPFTSPSQYPLGINPYSFVSRESPKSASSVSSIASISPQGKSFPDFIGSSPQLPQFSTPNKVKDRYSCKFCGKVFPRSANLTRHLRTHTGEQPYKCKYCERSFSISSNLQRHVRNIHNKEKPFRCQLCDRCFGQQTNLDRHLKKHETDGPNIVDSPELPERDLELDDKDESYFAEIRNFIGKATTNALAGDSSADINQNSLVAPSSAVDSKVDIEILGQRKLQIAEDEDEEIDPVSEDFDNKHVNTSDNKRELVNTGKSDNDSDEPSVKKARLSESVEMSFRNTEEHLPLCQKPGFELKRGFSPVMCS